MVKVNFDGNFLNVRTAKDKDGEIFTIKDEGKYNEITFKGVKKEVLNITVENNGKNWIWSPTMTQGKTLTALWGNETADWVGKKFQTFVLQDQLIVKPCE